MTDDELRRSEAKFRAVAEASPAAIFIVEGHRLTYVNPAMVELVARSREELLGTDPLDLLHPADREGALTRRALREAGQLGHERHEVRIGTRAGEDRWLDLSTSPIVYEGRAGLLGTGIDITDRKRLQEGLHQRQQFEAIGRLAGGVAHDFNNLLLVISGEAERLVEGLEPSAPLRGCAQAIVRAAERAAALTAHLLAFGRRQTLTAQKVDIGELITEVEPTLLDKSRDQVRSVLKLPAHLPPVRADRRRLQQVLVSLYANACDAMPEGGDVVVSADVVQVDQRMREGRPWLPPGGPWVRLRIADTGAGIPPAVLPRVFEPFFTTKRASSGGGLGLSTVYGIVKQSAGYVWLDSTPGAGACVTILLPPHEGAAQTASRELVARSAQARVLLVEDQDGVRDLLTTVLQRNGFEVVSAASAEAALDIAAVSAFDLLLTDVVLPGMTGLDLARRLRAQAPAMRVLFMSGYTGDALLDTSEFGGESAFLQKPFASQSLVARLRSLLAPPDEGTGRRISSKAR